MRESEILRQRETALRDGSRDDRSDRHQGLAFYWGTSEWLEQPPAVKSTYAPPRILFYTFLGILVKYRGVGGSDFTADVD
jgi:hypothetical protein